MQEIIPKDCNLADTFTYEVDTYDMICRTGSSHSKAFHERDLAFSTTTKNFDSMFTDEKTKSVFRNILEQVRRHKSVISFPYRCDTESYCTYYRLTVSISTTSHVLFYNKLLGMDSRSNGVVWKPVKAEEHLATPLCSVCNSLFADGSWMELQEMIDSKLWKPEDATMPCTYTVCDSCERGINHRISESKKQAHSCAQT